MPLGSGWDLRGRFDAVAGEIVSKTLARIVDELWEADWAEARAIHGDAACEAHLARTPEQRRADAMEVMARRAASMRPGTLPARPLISVLVDWDSLQGAIRETFGGIVLSTHQIAQLLTEADFERIVFGPDNRVIEVSERARFFTGGLRRAVEVRDRVCQHPTCTVEAEWCHVDHIVEHAAGGPTTQDNARLLCPTHNRQRPGRTKKPPPPETDDPDDPAPAG